MLCYHCMKEKGDAVYCPHCGKKAIENTSLHYLPAGTVIGGRYLLGYVLGEGGFGITYIGLDRTLDVPVAIKEYYPFGYANRTNTVGNAVSANSGTDNAVFYEKGKTRFLNEAKILARFRKEPGIVGVSDFLEENNTAYIVMEYLDGIDLRQYLKKHGVMTAEETLALMMPVIESLGKIHAAGVIHRDISPDNLMYTDNGTLKLMDFGAARDYSDDNRSMSVMLKQGYAPAEQYRRNGRQGPWTDVYAICATIYRSITGSVPVDSIDRAFSDTLKRPSELGITISPAIEDVLMYGMAVSIQDRCPDMPTLHQLFKKALKGNTITPSPDPVPKPPFNPEDATVYADGPDPLPEPPTTNKKKSRAPIIAAIAGVLAAVIVLLFIINPFGKSKDKEVSTAESGETGAVQETEGETHPDLKDYKFTETGDAADTFRATMDYLLNYIDSTAYGFDLSDKTITSYDTLSEDGCYVYSSVGSGSYDTTLKHYDDPRYDFSEQIILKGTSYTLNQTTTNDMLSDGWEYVDDKRMEPNKTISQHASLTKKGTRVAAYIYHAGDDPESETLHAYFLQNIDTGKSSNAFDVNGFIPSDDLETAVNKLGAPTSVHIYAANSGANVTLYYYGEDPKFRVEINFRIKPSQKVVEIYTLYFGYKR